MPDLADVVRLAEALVEREPDPVPRFRLLRDVLCVPRDDARLAECRWDLGPRASALPHFPLSESWRKPLARWTDCSTRVLALLRRYHDAAATGAA